jgi:hypothetical protein
MSMIMVENKCGAQLGFFSRNNLCTLHHGWR